jgi:hypothetical protein
MNKRRTRSKTVVVKKPKSPPNVLVEEAGLAEARTIAAERYPSHDHRLVAEIAARLAPTQREISRQDGAKIARSALHLLDAVSDEVKKRDARRTALLTSLSRSAGFPARLGWADGKRLILNTDGGGADVRFDELLKAKIRHNKLKELQAECLRKNQPEPNIKAAPVTTAKELNSLRSRFEKEGFTRQDLKSLSEFYQTWSFKVDGRRGENKKQKRKNSKKVL